VDLVAGFFVGLTLNCIACEICEGKNGVKIAPNS
jgi:hypothetical protein